MGDAWFAPRPGRLTSGKETRYPLYRRASGLQGRSGRVRKISPPAVFDPRTVHPVANRYTDYAIQTQACQPCFRVVVLSRLEQGCQSQRPAWLRFAAYDHIC